MPRKKQAHLKKESQLLVGLLILSLALVVSGCRRGPHIEVCVLDGDINNPGADCSKVRRGVIELNNYICYAPSDLERFLKACHDQVDAIVVTCILSSQDKNLACSNEAILNWEQSKNYSCIKPKLFKRLLKYCFR